MSSDLAFNIGIFRGVILPPSPHAHIIEALLGGGGGGAHVPRLNFTASYVAISEHSRVACRNFNNNFLARYQSDNLHLLQRRQRNIRPLSLVLLSPGF